jgi:aspartyl-tRNA(Asn)/glutamyl-tRNA(Gln) amidotransferase subunit A
VLDAILLRCEAVNPRLNAIVTFDVEGACRAARDSEARWRRGEARGPLDGVPLTVKDNIPVRGLRTTWGSRLLADHVTREDELPIGRLRAQVTVIFGKTNVPEFTLQGYTHNLLFGTTRNPWDPKLTPGGSSGGAVSAVAAGLGPLRSAPTAVARSAVRPAMWALSVSSRRPGGSRARMAFQRSFTTSRSSARSRARPPMPRCCSRGSPGPTRGTARRVARLLGRRPPD